MSPEEAVRFAEAWVDAWNRRDVDAVLETWADDAVFRSPRAGTVEGKEAIRDYWNAAIAPDLSMKLVDALAGVDGLVLLYENQAGRLCSEVFELDGAGRVMRASAYR